MRMMWAALGTAVVAAAGPALAAVPVEPQAMYAAASAQTWSVQPATSDGADGRASWEFDLAPGESVDDFAQVNNFGDQPLTFRVYSQDATNTPGGAFTLQPADVEPVEVGAWIGLSEQVTVAPGEHAIVPFTITVPADATPGDHAGGIVASILTQGVDTEGQQVIVDNRVGSRVYLRVAGALAPQLQIVRLEATYDRSWVPFSAGDVTATFQVRNTGNVRLAGEQTVTGQGLFGLGKHTMTLGDLPEILPGESVVVTVQIEDVAPLLRVTEQVTVHPRPPQTAEVTPAQATATVSVWAMPWSELGILVLLGLGGWWAWWQRRRRQRRTAAMLEEAVAKAREEARRELQQKSGQAGE
jgi:hypothetical protein